MIITITIYFNNCNKLLRVCIKICFNIYSFNILSMYIQDMQKEINEILSFFLNVSNFFL